MAKKVFKGWVCHTTNVSDLKKLSIIDDHVCMTMKCAREAWGPCEVNQFPETWPPKRVKVTVEVED